MRIFRSVIGRANPILAQEFRSTKSENTRWQNSGDCDDYLLLHTIVAKGGVPHDTFADFTYRLPVRFISGVEDVARQLRYHRRNSFLWHAVCVRC